MGGRRAPQSGVQRLGVGLDGASAADVGGPTEARGFEAVQEGMMTLTGSDGNLRHGEDRTVRA